MSDQGILFVIATPIGNLEDITFRAIDTLKKVKILLAEDTRITKKLLDHYGIQAKLESLHDYNESQKISHVIEQLEKGENVGLVSDAGTPLISDPGFKLVAHAQASGITIRPIPGASALSAAISVAGIPTDRFVFEGFLPRQSTQRIKYLQGLKYEPRTLVFFESPQRIKKSIKDCITAFGGSRKASLLRELTKHYEEHIFGELQDIQQALNNRTESNMGEFVLVIQGSDSNDLSQELESAKSLLADLQMHLSHKDAVEIVAKYSGIKRNQLYSLGLKSNDKSDN